MIHIDFETRSVIDLRKCGIYKYAQHTSTDINCMAWAIDDEPVELWEPGDPIPEALIEVIDNDHLVAAWNAQFERLIWNEVLARHGFPRLPIERFYCVAALSRARGYPGRLEKAPQFAGTDYRKDMEGHRLMMKLCKPRRIEEDGTIVWWDYRDDYKRLGLYCKQDVEVERAMLHHFIPFTDEELTDYHISERINDRGVNVDLSLVYAALSGVKNEKITADDTIGALTDGAVTACTQVQKIMEWVEREWKPLTSLGKSDILDALEEQDIPPHVHDVLELRLDNAKASVSKFNAIFERQIYGKVQGVFMFRGAGQTGRYSSVGLQLHNMVSDCNAAAIPILKKRGIQGLKMLGDPIKLLSQMVRPTFIAPPDQKFLIGDFAQIEVRIAAWLANEGSLLSDFRKGVSPYCTFGKVAFGEEITKHGTPEKYKISKACVLGLGFGGSVGALARTLKKENIVLSDAELLDLVQTYRAKYANIKKFWKALESAVLLAIFSPGTLSPVGPVSYMFDGVHLWCRLPSCRLVCYPFAEVGQDEYGDFVKYRRGNRSPKEGANEWPTVDLWYGLLIENLAQAIAYDILQGTLRRLTDWEVRLHVHDEIVVSVDNTIAEEMRDEFKEIMTEGFEWCVGLPLDAEIQISERYAK